MLFKVGQWVQNKKFRLRLIRAIYTRSTSVLSAQVTITELCFLPIFGDSERNMNLIQIVRYLSTGPSGVFSQVSRGLQI